MTNLEVPFVSQFDPQSNEDPADNCGPSCVSMVLNFYGEKTTVNQVYELTGAIKGQPITVAQLQQAIIALGYSSEFETNISIDNLKAIIDQNIPPIVLLHAGDLTSRQDQGFKGGHFVDAVGYRDDGYFVNDPDFWGQFRQDGDHHFYTKADFEKAWNDCAQDGNPNMSVLVIHPKAGALPDNFSDIVHGSTQWDAVVGKYIPSADPKHTDFGALQDVVGGIQSTATTAKNAQEKTLQDLAIANQQIENDKEKLALEESQRQADQTNYLAQIEALKPNADATKKLIDTYTGQIGVLQEQAKQLTLDKHELLNKIAALQVGQPQYDAIGNFFLLVASIFRKNK